MHPYVILDVFTDVPLRGNQLAVFTDAQGISSELMQQTARELNLAETVFLLPAPNGADARARIFTPATELPFAGHPVLGTAFVLGQRSGASLVQLQTGAGVIPITLTREAGEIVFGEMEQPIPTPEPFARAGELLRALRLAGSGFGGLLTLDGGLLARLGLLAGLEGLLGGGVGLHPVAAGDRLLLGGVTDLGLGVGADRGKLGLQLL